MAFALDLPLTTLGWMTSFDIRERGGSLLGARETSFRAQQP